MKRLLTTTLLSLCALTVAHCGSGIENTQQATPSEGEPTETTAILFSNDFFSAAEILYGSTDLTETSLSIAKNDNIGYSGSLAASGSTAYLINDAYSGISTDNLTVLDTANNFAVKDQAQYSAVNGTNPQAAIVIGDKAYISRYNPTADTTNMDANGNPEDIVIMDLSQNGKITGGISLSPFIAATGDKNANAGKMLLEDTTIYALMQDLDDANFFAVTVPGKLVSIDTIANTADAITLTGSNPTNLASSSSKRCLFITDQAQLDFATSKYQTDLSYGGLEIICENGTHTFIDDALLGGSVQDVAVSDSANRVLVMIGDTVTDATGTAYVSKVISLPLDALSSGTTTPAITTCFDPGDDIFDIALDPDDQLWIGHSKSSNYVLSNAAVDVIDATDCSALAHYPTNLTVTSIAFVSQ